MDSLVERQDTTPAILDNYVRQGRMYLFNAAQNLIEYGRVLVEAKPLLPHGQFENWVRTNFNMSERTAQGYMKVWRRFGQNTSFQDVQFSNLQKMLALPEGAETQFAEENDLEKMTAREVEEAVKKVKAEAQKLLAREQEARIAAENRAIAAENKPSEPDRGLIAQLAEKDAEIRKIQREADTAKQQQTRAEAELHSARHDLEEAEEMLAENQREYNRMQAELLNAQSTIARGDAERVISAQFTAGDFAAAARAFLGAVAQIPYMGSTFDQITDMNEYNSWSQPLEAIEDWAKKARKALVGTYEKGAVIDG